MSPLKPVFLLPQSQRNLDEPPDTVSEYEENGPSQNAGPLAEKKVRITRYPDPPGNPYIVDSEQAGKIEAYIDAATTFGVGIAIENTFHDNREGLVIRVILDRLRHPSFPRRR
jgi:hypothetical protein